MQVSLMTYRCNCGCAMIVNTDARYIFCPSTICQHYNVKHKLPMLEAVPLDPPEVTPCPE